MLKIINSKEKIIKQISLAQAQYKQELESVKDELLISKREREKAEKRISNLERDDLKRSFVLPSNVTSLSQTFKSLKNTKSNSKRLSKRHLSNSMKNSTLLIPQAKRLNSPSPSKKKKNSKKRIKKRKFSSGTRKSSQNVNPQIYTKLDALYNKNLQAVQLGQRIDLHQSKVKIQELQKVLSNLKKENLNLKSKLTNQEAYINISEYDKIKKILESTKHNNKIANNL